MKARLLTSTLCYIVLALVLGCSSDDTTVTEQRLLGTWQVLAIHNSSPTGPTLGPNTGEIISITFRNDGSLSGTTSANTFSGRFSATSNVVVIEQLGTTEIAETVFGQAFYESFNESRNSDTGFSEFESVFTNENSLNLEYQGFKFLTLQK